VNEDEWRSRGDVMTVPKVGGVGLAGRGGLPRILVHEDHTVGVGGVGGRS